MFLIESPHKSYRIYEGFGFSCKGRIAILFIFFFNPSVLRTPPLYFVLQKHPAMLRDTARKEGVVRFLSACFVFLNVIFYILFKPLALRTPPLYFCVAKTQRRIVWFISSFYPLFHFSFSPAVSRSLMGSCVSDIGW